MRLVTGDDGAISGMPDLIEPAVPSDAERQIFSRALLALAACAEFSGSQRNSTVEFSVSPNGVVEGSVLQTEPISPPSGEAASATESNNDPAANASQPQFDWVPATSQTQNSLNLKRKDIAELQARLVALGYDPKGIDGSAGAGMRSAVGTWQTSAGIPNTGFLDGPQLDRLKADSQPALDIWLANSDNSKLLAKASAPRKSSTRRGRNGWYRASNGNYCRLGGFGLWCQSWKPNAW